MVEVDDMPGNLCLNQTAIKCEEFYCKIIKILKSLISLWIYGFYLQAATVFRPFLCSLVAFCLLLLSIEQWFMIDLLEKEFTELDILSQNLQLYRTRIRERRSSETL